MQIIIFLFLYAVNIYCESVRYSGEAIEQKTNIKVYSNYGIDRVENVKKISSTVEYRDQQKTIAKKNINFSKNKFLPDFKLEDFRDGYMEGGELVGNQYRLYYKKNQNDILHEKIIQIKENAIADDGLDQLVLENFEEISEGKKIKFNFYVPYQLDFYLFSIEKVKVSSLDYKKQIVLKIEIDNELFKPFVKSTYIIYSVESKKVVYYEGISSINNIEGKSYFVKHTYFH